MRCRPRIGAALAPVFVLLAVPVGAGAATAGVRESCNDLDGCSTFLAFDAVPGEANDLAVKVVSEPQGPAAPAVYELADAAAPVTAGASCTQVDQHTVRCDVPAADGRLRVSLGDGDDRANVGAVAEIDAGPGDDTVNAVDANIHGGPGDDVLGGGHLIQGEQGADRITGGPGDDALVGGDGNDRISGGLGDDAAIGGPGDDFLAGGQGDDLIDGGTGRDRMSAGDGWDEMRANDFGPDVVDCAGGEDTAKVDVRDRVTACEFRKVTRLPRRSGCRVKGARVSVRTRNAVVLTSRSMVVGPGFTHVWACRRATGRAFPLAGDYTDASHIKLAGPYVAYALEFDNGAPFATSDFKVMVMDLRTGEVRFEDESGVAALVLAADGAIAWSTQTGVWRSEPGGGRLLDSAAQITRLRLHRHRISWLHDGAPRSARAVAP